MEETTTNGPGEHLPEALAEEQALLDQAVREATLQHLMNRCVQLNAQNRRLSAERDDV